MKKHPVDDRFARKLGEWSVTPSAEAWERIRQAQDKRKPLWQRKHLWFAAACSLLTFQTAYWIWSSYERQVVSEGNKLTSVRRLEKGLNSGRLDSSESRLGDDFLPGLEALKVQKPPLLENSVQSPANAAAEMIAMEKEGSLPLVEVKEDTTRREMEDLLVHEQEIAPDLPEKELAEVKPSPPVNSKEPDRVVIVHVAPREEEMKPSRFQRVLRQLKNAKQGEPVEWSELGLNPKKLFVKADGRMDENSK